MTTPKLFISALLLLLSIKGFSQTNTVTAAKIGIGTTTPGFLLHVLGSNASPSTNPVIRIAYNGKAEDYVGETGSIVFSKHYDLNATAKIYAFSEWGKTSYHESDLRFATGTSSGLVDRMVINQFGNVLIGKLYQQFNGYKLDVNGPIRANEVVVNTTGADFVFDKDYNLMPLKEVEKFIARHGHLPEIQPAAKMQQDGVELGLLNTKLLQKIEEMTLHQIRLEKALEQALQRIEKLEEKK